MGNKQRVNRKRLFQTVSNQGQSLRLVITPYITPFVMMLSVDRGRDERPRQKSIQINGINITENDSRLATEPSSEIGFAVLLLATLPMIR